MMQNKKNTIKPMVLPPLLSKNCKNFELLSDLKNNRITPQDDNTKQKSWKYCWAHGACSNVGLYYKYKADGREDTATFNDRKGGSELRLKKAKKE